FGEVPPAERSHAVQQDRVVAKVLVEGHPLERQHATLVQPLDQVSGQLWFSPERRLVRNAARLPALLVRLAPPPLGQVQAPIDQGVAKLTGIGGHHTGLAVGHLAQCSAPQTCHPDGVPALLREVAAVQDEHTRVRVAECLSDESLVLLQDRLVVPGTDTDELLHRLDVASLQRQCHRLDRLALQLQQLTLEILECPLALLLASEQRREQRVVADQFV